MPNAGWRKRAPSYRINKPPWYKTDADGLVLCIEAALERALTAADGADVRVGGGAATIRQYLRAGLIDEMHLAIVPILLGSGERLFDHLNGGADRYECVEFISSRSAAHVRLSRALK